MHTLYTRVPICAKMIICVCVCVCVCVRVCVCVMLCSLDLLRCTARAFKGVNMHQTDNMSGSVCGVCGPRIDLQRIDLCHHEFQLTQRIDLRIDLALIRVINLNHFKIDGGRDKRV